jgi:hypothetical protein
VNTMLAQVRLRVSMRTDGAVVPWSEGRSSLELYPTGSSGPAVAEAASVPAPVGDFTQALAEDTLPAYLDLLREQPRAPVAARVRAMVAVRREALTWSETLRADNARACWTYMRRYPRGPHFGDVRRRLAALSAPLEPPPRFDPVEFGDLAAPPPEELAALARQGVAFVNSAWPLVPPAPEALLPPLRTAFFGELPPPPIPSAGTLPIPLAVPLPPGRVSPPAGAIAQPYVPGQGVIAAEGGASSVVVSSRAEVLSRAVESEAPGQADVLQTGANGDLVSHTRTVRDGSKVTIVQTGPHDDVLTRSVTQTQADGERSSRVTNGTGQVISHVVSGTDGVVHLIAPSVVPPREQTFVVLPGAGARPMVVPVALAPRPGTEATPAVPLAKKAPPPAPPVGPSAQAPAPSPH